MKRFTTDKGDIMKTASTLRLLVLTAALTLALGAVGCDSKGAQINGLNNSSDDAGSSSNNGGGGDDVAVSSTDEEGHGTAPGEEEQIEPGFMNGSWRVAATEQDTPAVYLDTFQDKGDSEVTGTYLMAIAIYERLDGESGDLAQGSFDGGTLTVKWNPTTDPEEMFTLQASKVDDNTLEGNITAQRNTELDVPVKLTRRQN